MLDLLIIGAGTAGLTAAIYGVRAGLSVEVVEQTIHGGQIITTTSIENYPGMPGVSGVDFANALYRQAGDLGAKITVESVQQAELSGREKRVLIRSGERLAKSVILATGAKPRLLDVPGEEAFTGRGVSYCATCDGAFFKGKEVAVVGGGNTALEDALVLSALCSRVHLIHRRQEFRGERHQVEQVKGKENVILHLDSAVTAICGSQGVEHITLRCLPDNREEDLAVSGVFIAIGAQPDNALFASQVELDSFGYIVAGEDCKTNLPGVFAAGDTRTKQVRQIVTAAADGAVAALGAVEYIAGLDS